MFNHKYFGIGQGTIFILKYCVMTLSVDFLGVSDGVVEVISAQHYISAQL